MKSKSLRRQLRAQPGLRPVRIAVPGGSTTSAIVDLLEILVLLSGFDPTFHESEYGRFYDDPVHDPQSLIAFGIGLDNWFDWDRFFSYKILLKPAANYAVALSLNALIRSTYGKSRKVLVLDLDNTLWGGVIGDDGVDKIQIGRETPSAEAYMAFQEYCLALRSRGILLAVCSKNTF